MKRCSRCASPAILLPACFLLCFLHFLVLGPPPLEAQQAAYSPPKEYLEVAARTLALATALLAMGLTAWVLIGRRKRLGAVQSRVVLFLGVCVLPIPVMVLSTAVGVEEAKAVDFCASCHVMGPYVQGMEDPAASGLAALHFQNRYIQSDHCYVCHTNYGLFGTMEAKVGGLGHIWQDATASHQGPIQLKNPYNFSICLDCHGLSARFNAQEVHQAVLYDILSSKAGCTDCHPLGHPAAKEGSRP
jgi:nitrate/TMAO reductase-like tetraheme cytochrome c subunit